MLSSYLVGLLLLSQASAEKDPSRIGQKHGCTADGRYWVHADKGKKVYCWEGAGYNEDQAPQHVKGYFEESSESSASPQMTLPDVVVSPVGSTPVTKPSASSGGGSGGGGNAAPKFSVGGGGGGILSGGAASSGGAKVKDALRDLARDPSPSAASNGRREPDPVNPSLFSEIENGMDRATVIARLGEPHGKILNTGDEGSLEIWTYVVRGGAFASVRMENNKVIKVVKPR